MRENRQSGSEGGEPQTNAAFLPISIWGMTMSGVVNPVCRPSGPLGFYFAPATGAFDPGRGCTSPPGLELRVVDLP
jgi:hypothetical protein